MDRRQFMGNTLAGFVAPHLPVTAMAAPQTSPDSLRRARWLDNGIIDAGGIHEPYIFVLRRGGQRLDAYEEHQRNQSEALIRRLKDQGVEIFHTHLYKGFGMAAEKSEMEETKRAAEIAHRYEMKVDTYIQWNTMMYETFFAEEPRAKEWIQRDALGQPLLLPYGFQQSFRYRPCFAHQEYLDYLKMVVRYAILEVKTDFIHFDNFGLSPEPDSCHCRACVEGFRRFLRTKYSAETRRERIGFENVDFMNPPLWNQQNRPENMDIIYDPGIQEWIDYRCQMMADALRQVALYAKSLNPEVAIEVNLAGITGSNRAWEDGIDHARILKWTEVFWTEEGNPPGYLPDGRLISRIRSFKLGRAFQNRVLTYISDNPIAMAECLAFNQTLGYVGNETFTSDPIQPAMGQYIAFYRKNRDLYVGSEDVATIALLRSYPSLTYHHSRAQLCAILTEQALIQARVLFDLVFDDQLDNLSKYKVLVLPNSECLSDRQLSRIRGFVADGGGLVAIAQAGLYDDWRRLRTEPGLRGFVEKQPGGEEYLENSPGFSVESTRVHTGPVSRKEVGRGRVAYIPDVVTDGPQPEGEPYFSIRNNCWKRPKNWQEIIDSVVWAARGDIPVDVIGPDSLIINLVSQPEKRRMILHLVNYRDKLNPLIESVKVVWRPPQGRGSAEVRIVSPDAGTPELLTATMEASGVSFTIPAIHTYSVAIMKY